MRLPARSTGLAAATAASLLLLSSLYALFLVLVATSTEDVYTVTSKYPYAVLADSDGRVYIVDYSIFYGAPFPYNAMPLAVRAEVSVEGLRSVESVSTGIGWLGSVYYLASLAPYARAPLVVVGRSADQAVAMLESTMITRIELENVSGVLRGSTVLPASLIPEGYEPQYAVIVVAEAVNRTVCVHGLGCRSTTGILYEAHRLLVDYMNKPSGRAAEAEALSLIHEALKPLYRVYGYTGAEGVRITVRESYTPLSPLVYFFPLALGVLAVALAALAVRIAARRAPLYPCASSSKRAGYAYRVASKWVVVAGLLGLGLELLGEPVGLQGFSLTPLLFLLPGLRVVEEALWLYAPCKRVAGVAWLASVAGMASVLVSSLALMASMVYPGPLFPLAYRAGLPATAASIAALAAPLASGGPGRGWAVAAMLVLPVALYALGEPFSLAGLVVAGVAASRAPVEV